MFPLSLTICGILLLFFCIKKVMDDINENTCFVYAVFYVGLGTGAFGLAFHSVWPAYVKDWSIVVIVVSLLLREVHDKRRAPLLRSKS